MTTTTFFPSHWRVTVEIERPGVTDPKGDTGPSTFHSVADCLVSNQSTEDESRKDLPDTTAYIHAPAGADFAPHDLITVPEGDRLWPWGRFVVNGDPNFTPLGVRVQLRRV